MTLLTRASNAGLDTSTGMFAPQLSGLVTGEAIDVAAPCYIKSSDGKIYMADGTAANEAAEAVGFSPRAAASGEPLTLFGVGARFRYAAGGLTPGDYYYLGATAGRLDDAATTGGIQAIAMAVTATDIIIVSGPGSNQQFGAASLKAFVSTEQTGTGSPQNVAHGLGVTPTLVLIAPTDTAPATAGDYTVTEGSHDATNVVATVTSGKKFKVLAIAP